MQINDFLLERYFAQHEFTAKYLLSSSDCEAYSMQYVLEQASTSELKLWESIRLGYTESKGHPLLRESILQYYEQSNIDNVVVASPGELNFIAMNVLLSTQDHVVVVSPCYQSLSEVVVSLGCSISYWKPNEADWTFDVEDLRGLIRDNTKLLILNFPHNPTGAYLSNAQVNEIIEVAREKDLYIFSDEMYRKLLINTEEEMPALCDLYPKALSLWGSSKSFGLAGLRLGWLVGQDQALINEIVAFKDYLSICNNAPSEVLQLIALNHSEAFIQPNIEKIKHNVTLFQNFLKGQTLFGDLIPPQAGSTSFIPLNIETSAIEFSDKLVVQTGIMTVPAEMFGHKGKYIRIGFGRDNFGEILAALQEFL